MDQRPQGLKVQKAITGFLQHKSVEGLAHVTIPENSLSNSPTEFLWSHARIWPWSTSSTCTPVWSVIEMLRYIMFRDKACSC